MTSGSPIPPVRLAPEHDLETFDCGVPALNDWLKRRARRNEASGTSRSYVICDRNRVIGYYCLAAGAVARDQAPKPIQRNVPDPIPVMVLGRLAIDLDYQGQGIGSALLRDAILRVLQAAAIVGVRAILVHAISEEAKAFYLARGFLVAPIEPMTLCLPLDGARAALLE